MTSNTAATAQGRWVCPVCGRSISKRGYSRQLVRHNAPADVVHAHTVKVRAEQAAWEAERDTKRIEQERIHARFKKLGFEVTVDGGLHVLINASQVERMLTVLTWALEEV